MNTGRCLSGAGDVYSKQVFTDALFDVICHSPLLLQVKSLKEDLQKGKVFHISSIYKGDTILTANNETKY